MRKELSTHDASIFGNAHHSRHHPILNLTSARSDSISLFFGRNASLFVSSSAHNKISMYIHNIWSHKLTQLHSINVILCLHICNWKIQILWIENIMIPLWLKFSLLTIMICDNKPASNIYTAVTLQSVVDLLQSDAPCSKICRCSRSMAVVQFVRYELYFYSYKQFCSVNKSKTHVTQALAMQLD